MRGNHVGVGDHGEGGGAALLARVTSQVLRVPHVIEKKYQVFLRYIRGFTNLYITQTLCFMLLGYGAAIFRETTDCGLH